MMQGTPHTIGKSDCQCQPATNLATYNRDMPARYAHEIAAQMQYEYQPFD